MFFEEGLDPQREWIIGSVCPFRQRILSIHLLSVQLPVSWPPHPRKGTQEIPGARLFPFKEAGSHSLRWDSGQGPIRAVSVSPFFPAGEFDSVFLFLLRKRANFKFSEKAIQQGVLGARSSEFSSSLVTNIGSSGCEGKRGSNWWRGCYLLTLFKQQCKGPGQDGSEKQSF